MPYEEVRRIIRGHIVEQYLPGEDPNELTDDVRLISDGILDSLATLRFVAFLEERFGVKVAAHEIDVDHLDSLATVAKMVCAKKVK